MADEFTAEIAEQDEAKKGQRKGKNLSQMKNLKSTKFTELALSAERWPSILVSAWHLGKTFPARQYSLVHTIDTDMRVEVSLTKWRHGRQNTRSAKL
jgi:hypothetical protein